MLTNHPVRKIHLRTTVATAVATATLLAVQPALACVGPQQAQKAKKVQLVEDALSPATSQGTTLVAGMGVFNSGCQPTVGNPPGNLGDYPAIEMSGSLFGCWYTYVSKSQFNPSGTYLEQGSELFVGCLDVVGCGTFETVYTFTGKYVDDTFAEEIHGRCEHRIVDGTGAFAGAMGVINFKDDVFNLKLDYKGQINLAQ